MIYSFHWEIDKDIEYLCSNFSKFYYIASISKDENCQQYVSNIYVSQDKTVILKDSSLNILKIKTKMEYMNLTQFGCYSNLENLSYKETYNNSLI